MYDPSVLSTSPKSLSIPHQSAMSELNVATINVRYDRNSREPVPIPHDGPVLPTKRWKDWVEIPWSERRTWLVDCLLSTGPLDIIGFQEVLHNQLRDLQDLLGDTYRHVGVGRDDGKTAGEYSPIFYDRTQFEELGWRTIWLSKTSDVPGSKDWDANLTRIATFLCLRRIWDGGLIHVINTHYDDMGKRARAESSYIIREEAEAYFRAVESGLELRRDAPATAIVLLGDFNSPPSEAGYGNISSPDPVPSGKPSYTFTDAYTQLRTRSGISLSPRQSAPYGPESTYSTFGRPGSSEAARIDFVFLGQKPSQTVVSENGKTKAHWVATRYACLDNSVWGEVSGWKGRWSDHRAVRVKLELQVTGEI